MTRNFSLETTPVATTTTTTSPGSFQCPSDSGNFPNPGDCSTYWTCSNGYPFLNVSTILPVLRIALHNTVCFFSKSCPPGLAFNPVTSGCDWAYNVPGCDGNHIRKMFKVFQIISMFFISWSHQHFGTTDGANYDYHNGTHDDHCGTNDRGTDHDHYDDDVGTDARGDNSERSIPVSF